MFLPPIVSWHVSKSTAASISASASLNFLLLMITVMPECMVIKTVKFYEA